MKAKYYQFSFLVILALSLCLPFFVHSQAIIQGVVTDESGETIIGGNVVITGTTQGTTTDFDGSYSIGNVPAGRVSVTASYVGYKDITKEIEVGGSGTYTLDFKMGEDTEILSEVVVVGYGTQRRRDLVGAVDKIEGEELSDQIGNSFEAGIQGKVPSVQIIQGSGSAGSHNVVRIRGVSSISAGGDPLYVIDGMIMNAQNMNYLLGENAGQNHNPLSVLNPADIASVEVLKDASAAAIYGSRATNGVIIITTKRGSRSKGKPTFNFSSRLGFGRPTNVVEVLNAEEWLAVQQEAWENNGGVGRAPLPNGLSYEDIEGVDTDWIDKTIRTGVKQDYNLSTRYGNKWLSAYAGLSYSDNESYLENDAYERISGRVNLDITASEKIKIGINSNITRGLRDKSEQSWAGGLGMAQSTALPIYPVTVLEFPEESDQYGVKGYYNIYNNPVAQYNLRSIQTREWRYINSLQMSYMPMDNLTFTLKGNYEQANLGDFRYEDEKWTTTQDYANANMFLVKNASGFFTGQYDLNVAEKHNIAIMAGGEYTYNNTTGKYLELRDVGKQLYRTSGFRDTLADINSFDVWEEKFLSAFTRITYNYDSRYYVQAVLRADGSSKFGSNRRWGFFPSLGLGYIMSEEKFWPKDNFAINYLKIRSSAGLTGNSNIDYREQFAIFNQNMTPGSIDYGNYYNNGDTQHQGSFANPNLQWESTAKFDVGVDMGLWQDRVTATVNYYYNLTYGNTGFVNEQLQASTGADASSFQNNVGSWYNQGLELELKSRNLVGPFSWTTDFNIARNRNKVTDVGNATPDALDGGFGDIRVIKGQPIGVNYLIEFSHVDSETGRPVYLDIDGNETFEYNEANRVAAGNLLPDFIGGLRNTFRYKNFDLDILFYFQKGGTIYDDAAKRQKGSITPDWNYTPEIFDRWRQPGDIATYPRLSNPAFWGLNSEWNNNHTLWLYDASYLRLRTLTIGYNIKPNADSGFSNIRLSLSGTNLWTLTSFPGWDPEVSRSRTGSQERNIGGSSVTYLSPPQEKSFILGVSVDF